MLIEHIEKYNKPHIKPDLCVIWLHGLGADCNDFVPIVNELPLTKSVKFIFPNAPMRPITINNGYVMRGWYDIIDLSRIEGVIDMHGINASVAAIHQLIEAQLTLGFNSTQIIIAGFSQGGVISYCAGLTYFYKLAGIISLSCYLPNIKQIMEQAAVNKLTPIFAAHGLSDPVVPYVIGKLASDELIKNGFNLKWYEYPMPHSVCQEQIVDIASWLNSL